MKLLYNFGILLYYGLVYVASFFNDKAAKFVSGRKDVFSYLKSRIVFNDKCIWMHVSSLGEFEQGRPIIESVKRSHPEYKIILTFFLLPVMRYVRIMTGQTSSVIFLWTQLGMPVSL